MQESLVLDGNAFCERSRRLNLDVRGFHLTWRAKSDLSVVVEKEPDAILDLTALLVTGKASEALSDLLGSGGENMGDRVTRP